MNTLFKASTFSSWLLPLVTSPVWGAPAPPAANVTFFDLYISGQIISPSDNSELLKGANEILFTADNQIAVSVPMKPAIIFFNLTETQSESPAQILTNGNNLPLKGAQGLAISQGNNDVRVLAVTATLNDAVSLFRATNTESEFESFKVFSRDDASAPDYFLMASPHRSAFSRNGLFLGIISNINYELYLFRKTISQSGQEDWSYGKALNYTAGNALPHQNERSTIYALDEDNQFLITSYSLNAVFHIRLQTESNGLITDITQVIPAGPENSPACLGPSNVLELKNLSSIIIACGESDAIYIFDRKTWEILQIIDRDTFDDVNRLDGVHGLSYIRLEDDSILLFASASLKNFVTVFYLPAGEDQWQHIQTLTPDELGGTIGYKGIAASFSTIPVVVLAADKSIPVITGQARPVFDQSRYDFTYPLQAISSNDFEIGRVIVDFMLPIGQEGAVSVEGASGTESEELFFWQNNTLFLNGSHAEQVADNSSWALLLRATNDRDQETIAQVSLSVIFPEEMQPAEDESSIPQIIGAVVGGGLLGTGIIVTAAATLYACIHFSYRSYSPETSDPETGSDDTDKQLSPEPDVPVKRKQTVSFDIRVDDQSEVNFMPGISDTIAVVIPDSVNPECAEESAPDTNEDHGQVQNQPQSDSSSIPTAGAAHRSDNRVKRLADELTKWRQRESEKEGFYPESFDVAADAEAKRKRREGTKPPK